MTDWARYCNAPASAGGVVPLAGEAMKKKPTKDIDKSLEELMLENLGAGTSQLPSDNLSMLDWDVREEPWIDAIHVADKNRDPQPLITLLEKERVPPRVMPFREVVEAATGPSARQAQRVSDA